MFNELQIDKVFLVAASAGGSAGIRFALDYPERLKGLILLSVKSRRKGIIYDSEINNIDMSVNYYDYPVEKIEIPILVVHASEHYVRLFLNLSDGIVELLCRSL